MRIKRPVVQADTSGQLSLHLDGEGGAQVQQSPSNSTRAFIEPDPEYMQIGLKEHLQRSGQEHVFVIDELLKQQDWSVFEADYVSAGRRPYAPRVMVALILYGVMQGRSSLRELETLSRDSLGCMWLSGGVMPDHSSIGRFISRHATALSGEFFEQLTRSVLSYTGSGVAHTAGDATVVEAAASRYATIKREALERRIDKEQRCIDDENEPPNSQNKERSEARLKKLKEADTRLREREASRQSQGKDPKRVQINPEEPDAVNQPLKQQGYGVCYKPGILANEQRVIVGHGVDATSETRVALETLAQARRFGELRESSWDAGYSNQEMLLQQAIYDASFLIPEGRFGSSRENRRKKYPKSEFSYDAQRDVYLCPAGELLTVRRSYKATATRPAYTRYGTSACRECKQRAHCTTNKTGRRIDRYAHDHLREQMREKMQGESAQAQYKQRAALAEPVFSHLQLQQGLTRFRRKGLRGVKVEFGVHVLAHNVSRVVAHWRKNNTVIALTRLYRSLARLLKVLRPRMGSKSPESATDFCHVQMVP